MGNSFATVEKAVNHTDKTEELLRLQALEEAWDMARMRDNWYWMLLGLTSINCVFIAHGVLKKNMWFAAPSVPSMFALAYYYDLSHGLKRKRMIRGAEKILDEEAARFVPPRSSLIISQDEYIERFVTSRPTRSRSST